MCMMVGKDVSGAVGGGAATADAGNPLMGGGSAAMVPYQQPAGYPARLPNGVVINFASEADFLKANNFVQTAMQQPAQFGGAVPQIGGSSMGGSGSGRFLRTASDGAETIAAFLEGRNLRRRRDDLLDALDRSRAARARLDTPAMRSAHPDLIPALLEYIDADRDVSDAAITTIEDTLTAIDIQTGAGVAKVADDLLSDNPQGFGNNALVAGAVGLGVGALLLGGSTRERGGRRRR